MFYRKKLFVCAEEVTNCFYKQLWQGCEKNLSTNFSDVRSRWSLRKSRCKMSMSPLLGMQHMQPTGPLDEIPLPPPLGLSNRPPSTDYVAEVYNIEDMDESSSTDRSPSGDRISTVRQCLTELRQVEYTDYGLRLQESSNARDLKREVISLATYNVLSQSLLEAHRYLYKKSHPKELKWASRSKKLLEEFEILNPDIFCLQEVENKDLKSFFNPELERLGYMGVYKQRTRDKVDGCAIFFKKEKFNLVLSHSVELFKNNITLLNRDNIGIVLKLSLKSRPEQHIVVSTTHLLYNPRRADIKLTQTQVMLAEIEKVAFRENGTYWPVIFTGDMNYKPDSAVYKLVSDGYLQYEGRTDRQLLESSRGTTLEKELLPSSLGVTDSCQFASTLAGRLNEEDAMFGSGALEHRLNFGSVYTHRKCGESEATSYHDEWTTVDYIYYSQNRKGKDRVEGDLKLMSRLTLPSGSEMDSRVGHTPNRCCGSDHLPLKATFHLSSNS